MEKPVIRNSFRLYWGAKYFTLKRHLKLRASGSQFAGKSSQELIHEIFSHRTPLIRDLKDSDMVLQYNKIVNLKIAIEKLNNVIIRPGEIFSYWKLIGKPTERKGYRNGMVLQNGTVQSGIGGGLCQISNMIYWMTIHTPLTVVERHRHGYDVFPDVARTQPFGSGATCFYNYVDLILRNDTDRSYQLDLKVTDKELQGAWRSDRPAEYRYEIYEKQHMMQSEYWGGYTRHNVLFRKIFDLNDNVIADEYVVENHALMMYQPFLDGDV